MNRSTPPPSNPSLGRDSPTLTGRSRPGLGAFKKALASPFFSLKKLLRRPKEVKLENDPVRQHRDPVPVPDLAVSKPFEESEPLPPAFSSSGSLSSIELTPYVASNQQVTQRVNSPASDKSPTSSSCASSPAASTTQSDVSLAPTISSATRSVSSLSTLSTVKASEDSSDPATPSATGTGSFVSAVTSLTKEGSPRTTATSPDNFSQATLSSSSFSSGDQFEVGLMNGPVLSFSSESDASSTPASKGVFCSPPTNGSSNVVEFASSSLRGSSRPFYLPPWSSVNTSPAPDDGALGDVHRVDTFHEPEPFPFDEEEESPLTEIFLKDDKGPNAAAVLPSLAFQDQGPEVDPHPRSPAASSLSYFCNFFSTGPRFLSFGGMNGNLVSSPGHDDDDAK